MPKTAVIAIGSSLSLILVLACGASFLNATGIFDSSNMSSGSNVSQKRSAEDEALRKKNQEEFNKRSEELKASFLARTDDRKRIDPTPSTPKPATRTPFGGDSTSSGSTTPSEDENPFAAAERRSKEQNQPDKNPFGDSASNTSVEKPDKHRDPFGAMNFDSRISDGQQRFEFAKRFNRGDSLIRFQQRGFSNSSTKLNLGKSAGTESRIGKVFYSDNPIDGIAFFAGTPTYLLPSWSDQNSDSTTCVKPDESVYGVNLNFQNGKLAGVQGIFSAKVDGRMENTNLSTGDWLGRAPAGEEFTTIDGGGSQIHGFVVGQKGFDIIGFQLIVEK